MIHLQSFASSGFFVVLLCFVARVLALQNAGSFECTPWKKGEKVTIVFRIDRSKFPSLCQHVGRPRFEMSVNSTISSKIRCTVAVNINTSGACNFQRDTMGCGCTDQNEDDHYRLEYNFIADSKIYERWWKATIDCLSAGFSQVISFTQTGCQPIPDEPTTTSATTESSSSSSFPASSTREATTEQTTKSSEGGSNGSNGKTIGGAVGGSIAAVVAGSVVAFAVYKSYKKKHACNTATDARHTANGNSGGMSGTTREKPPVISGSSDRLSTQPLAPKSEVSQSDVSLVSGSAPMATVASAYKPRELPQPKTTKDGHAGPVASHSVENEMLAEGGSALPAEGARKLPQPNGAEQVTPRLAPLYMNASSSLTSVERNSYVEPKQPLPPIYK